MHQYYKINRREVFIFALLLFLCFVSRSSVSQSISYLSSSTSPLFYFFQFISVHTFLQEQITVLECQPLELDHHTSNVADCKKPLGTNMRTKMKNLCLYEIERGGGGSQGSSSSFSQYKIASAGSPSSPLRPHVSVLCVKCECMAV